MPLGFGKEAKKLVINNKPLLINEEAIVFKRGPRILGKVKATYDFSELPSHMHEIAYQMLDKSQVVHWTI